MKGSFDVRVPWWAKLIGWWRRRQFERRDRAEKIRLQSVLVYQGTLIGRTHWIDCGEGKTDWTQNTHRWDFFESPDGKRSVTFIRMGGYYRGKNGDDGADNHLHVTVTKWLNRKWDFHWEKTTKENSPWGWNK